MPSTALRRMSFSVRTWIWSVLSSSTLVLETVKIETVGEFLDRHVDGVVEFWTSHFGNDVKEGMGVRVWSCKDTRAGPNCP